MIKIILLFLLVLSSHTTQAQNFHKVFTFGDTTSLLSGVMLVDSTIYISGNYGRGFQREYGLLATLSREGDPTVYSNKNDDYLHLVGFSNGKLDTLNNGNFFVHYSAINKEVGIGRHVNTIWSKEGQLLNEQILDTLEDAYISHGNTMSRISNEDSKIYTFGSYNYIPELDTSNNSNSNYGLILQCFDQELNLLWRVNLQSSNTTVYFANGINFLDDGHVEIVYFEFNQRQGLGAASVVYFDEYDNLGNLVRKRTFRPEPVSMVAPGVELINNGKNYLITYSQNEVKEFGGNIERTIIPTLALLDTALNFVWQAPMHFGGPRASSGLTSNGRSPRDYVLEDSTVVFAHTYLLGRGISDTIPFTCLMIQKRSMLNGEAIWNRTYQYYDDTNFVSAPHYHIYDASFVPYDSGYVFVGTSYNPSAGAGNPSQLAYAIKTNCLGHLNDPVAGLRYEVDDQLNVAFESTSMHDGGVIWDFGDGTSVSKGEYDDHVSHQYASAGTYEVTLIATGCRGARDTVVVSLTLEESQENLAGSLTKYLTLAPNPIAAGDPLLVYIGSLPQGAASLMVYDQMGRQLNEIKITEGQTQYVIPLNFSAGSYHLMLMQNGQKLDHEILVVR